MNKKYYTIALRVEEETKKALEEKATAQDRTVSSVIRLIIKKELTNNER